METGFGNITTAGPSAKGAEAGTVLATPHQRVQGIGHENDWVPVIRGC